MLNQKNFTRRELMKHYDVITVDHRLHVVVFRGSHLQLAHFVVVCGEEAAAANFSGQMLGNGICQSEAVKSGRPATCFKFVSKKLVKFFVTLKKNIDLFDIK